MSDNLTAETLQEIASFADTLLTKFASPEFISGCQVMGTADMNQYATGNGWVEALCGQHNQQRVRWKSGETIGTTNYIDVVHFPAYHLFEAWGIAGTAAISSGGGIPTTIIDAKGDLIVGGGADDPQRFAIGANEKVLTADSTQTLGVRWDYPYILRSDDGTVIAQGSYTLGQYWLLMSQDIYAADIFMSAAAGLTFDNSAGMTGEVWLHKANGLRVHYSSYANAYTAAAASGDTIFFHPGTYTLNAQNVAKSVTLKGEDALSTIIQGTTNNSYVFLVSADNVRIENLTITQTGAGGAGTNGWPVQITGNNCVIKDCDLSATGATAANYALYHSAGNTTKSQLINCNLSTSGATANYGYVNGAAAAKMDIIGGSISGATADIYSDQASVITLENPRLLGGVISITGSATLQGCALDDKGRDCGSIITNISGGTVARGAIGYVDNAGAFKTTTTAQDSVSWHIATTGGANNSKIFAKNKGKATVNYTGTAPNAGDYLVTSTTGGSAQQQTTMHPAIFAVCLAAGSGGTVEVLLLCNTAFVPASASEPLYRIDNHNGSDFVATIATLPGGAVLTYNAPSSGNENNLPPYSAANLGKLVIHNTTRGTNALLDSCVVGTNTITLTANVPAGWAVNDTITMRSQTNTQAVGSDYFYEVDLSSADNTAIPALARAVTFDFLAYDSGGGGGCIAHPFVAFSDPKQIIAWVQVAATIMYRHVAIPLTQQRFTICDYLASGTGTKITNLRLTGYFLAVP